ncbi:CaiB/BaiF CoA transferase family protein [Georgenia sp. AZ-5]|uniref:CaiB/BaiF CoA transferase family protein n=1 Tax=Georgenia sp. AZ-5 TaxID=3367526 RepID=UPI003754EAA0
MSHEAAPLKGIRVLELGSMYAAPTAGRMLRDFGAEVLKVEDPVTGDFARQWQPQHNGLSIGFARINAGKRSLGVDLRSPRGRDVVLRLAPHVDVVVESFRPGRLEQWGLGYDALRAVNERIILTRVSGFGQTGPYRDRPGFGTIAEAVSGYAFLNGWPQTPPTAPPFGFADSIAGIAAAYGTAMALFARERGEGGREVDVALYEPLMFILGDAVLRYSVSGEITQRQGNASGAASPRGIYQAGDGGWLSIAASSQSIAMRLFDAMARPEMKTDPRFATNAARMQNNELVQEVVRGWVGSMSRDQVLRILGDADVVAAAVNDASDIAADPHFRYRTLAELTGSALGSGIVPGPVLHLEGYAGPAYDGVPEVGQHTREVLSEVAGMAAEEVQNLADDGVLGGVTPLVGAEDRL